MAASAGQRPVLVLRFSAAGDIVLSAPALRALRLAWPGRPLVFVTHARFAPLVAQPWVDAVVPLLPGAPVGSLVRRLRALRPAAVLDLHGKPRAALLRLGLPTARHVTWRKRPLAQTLAMRLGDGRYRAAAHIAARYHAAVERLVGRPLPRQPLAFHVPAAAAAAAAARLRAAGVRPGPPLLGISPGAAWASKRWPLERFVALAAWARGRGLQVVVTGSDAEAAANRALAAVGAVDLSGALDLPGLAAVIAGCDAFVANDSGPMHLARALRVPTVALFGGTDPRQFDFAGHVALGGGVDCAPCSFHGLRACPRGHLRCLREVPLDAVQQAVARQLQAGRAAPVMG